MTQVVEVAVAAHFNGRFFLRQNPVGQRWAGLWDFIRFPLDQHAALVPESGFTPGQPLHRRFTAHVEKTVAGQSNLQIRIDRFLAEQKHTVTRYQIRLQCLYASVEEGSEFPESRTQQWVLPSEFDAYPLSTTGRKFARLLQQDARQLRLL
jgi:A/G-specific adenine glycosylase